MHLESVACPDLAPIIQGGFPFDEHVVETVREYCAPLRAAEVDTVILGCTHYPLVAPMLQRMLGRGVTLVTSGAGVARSVERALAARDLLNPRARRGRATGFACTGDVEAFRKLGTRFLQMPLGEVEHVDLERTRWPHDASAATTALPTACGRSTIEPGFVRTATGSALISVGETRVICTASVQDSVPRWLAGGGRGWVTAEYGMLPASTGERKQRDVSRGPRRRPHGRDPAPDRALAARRDRLRGARRAHGLHRLRRAPGRRRHALRVDHRRAWWRCGWRASG